jgi:hypothetical protein
MKKVTRFHAMLMAVVLAVGTAAVVRADHGGNNNNETRLRTKLAGGAIQGKTPEGNAEFRMDQKGRTSFKVEVENVNLPAGTVLDVTLTDAGTPTVVGHITLNAFGEGELELQSQDGDTVPAAVKGDIVTVLNAGSPILSGTF